jgi:hypothetical protein
MKIDEAKSRVLTEWYRWQGKSTPATYTEKYTFYTWLQRERPDLLAFKCSGDRWQRIHGWIGAGDERP